MQTNPFILCVQIAFLDVPAAELVNGAEVMDSLARVLIQDPNPYVYGINEEDEPPMVFENCAYTLITVEQVPPPSSFTPSFPSPPSPPHRKLNKFWMNKFANV